MAGGIYSDQRCPICGGAFRDDNRRGLACPQHPQQRASRFKVKLGDITKRFRDYDRAQAFLGGLRHEKGPDAARAFDPRDYQIKKKPLSFQVLSAKGRNYNGKYIQRLNEKYGISSDLEISRKARGGPL